ncbi:MAG: hypothetical protein ACI9OJ_000564 [Myxococcota bacterium]|jgi:hypothetical protein
MHGLEQSRTLNGLEYPIVHASMIAVLERHLPGINLPIRPTPA